MFKRLTIAICVFSAVLFSSGCASNLNNERALLTPGSDISHIKTIYVVTQPRDTHGIDKLIHDKLVAMGYSVMVGPEKPLPYNSDAVVTYRDKWFWDMSMYLLQLIVTVRNPSDNFPLAVGDSLHWGLYKISPPEMVNEVVTNIFEASNSKS